MIFDIYYKERILLFKNKIIFDKEAMGNKNPSNSQERSESKSE